jgi:hypothetical protein
MDAMNSTRKATRDLFLPIFILAAACTLWAIFQMFMLFQEGGNLKALLASQEPTVQQAQKLRAQLDSIAAQTQLLADGGNPGAKVIVDELRKRGITINPHPTSASGGSTTQ